MSDLGTECSRGCGTAIGLALAAGDVVAEAGPSGTENPIRDSGAGSAEGCGLPRAGVTRAAFCAVGSVHTPGS